MTEARGGDESSLRGKTLAFARLARAERDL